MVRSWFDKITGKVDNKKINTNELKTFPSNVLQLNKVRKQLRITDEKVTKKAKLINLLKDKFEAAQMTRIVVPPSHRYQALLAVHHKHW